MILTTLVAAVTLDVAAQIIAGRFERPANLPLLCPMIAPRPHPEEAPA